MYLLKTIIFIGLAVHLTHCGGQNNNESTVKVAKVEDGVAKAEDGRVILSSQSEGDLVIPEGALKGLRVDSTKLANAILSETQRVSEVYNLSMASGIYIDDFDIFGFADRGSSLITRYPLFTTSFSVKTVSGKTYHGIECHSHTSHMHGFGWWFLELGVCESDQVVVRVGRMSMEDVVDEKELSARLGLSKTQWEKPQL